MDTVKINVGGKVFVTTRRTINRYPDTRLGSITKNETCGNENQDIYFDKNPKIFQSVLDYYRSGNLHINTNYCADYVKEELKFWGVDRNLVSKCCIGRLSAFSGDQQVLKTLERNQKHNENVRNVLKELTTGKCSLKCLQAKGWLILDEPTSSLIAKVSKIANDFCVVCPSIYGY